MNLALITHKVIKGEGQARVNYELARRAGEKGWHVTLVAGQVAPELQACPHITWVPIPWSDRCSELVGVWDFARRSAHWLRAHRADFDIVQVSGVVTRGRSDVNSAHFVHAAWRQSEWHPCRARPGLHGAYQGLFSALNARWERQAFCNAAQIVAVSHRVRQELLDAGVSEAKIRVIGNGVDLEEFHPGVEDRVALGLPSDVPLGLFVGNLRLPRKNLETVLQAMTRLPDLYLAVVGDVANSPYPALAEQSGVGSRVHFLGLRTDVPALMRACDFLAFPSRYEPFGLVLLEALASGLPVLTAAPVGAAEIITPDCGHVLADAEDVDGFVAVAQRWMQRWMQQPELRRHMGLAARRIAQEHSWQAMADAYLELYAEQKRVASGLRFGQTVSASPSRECGTP